MTCPPRPIAWFLLVLLFLAADLRPVESAESLADLKKTYTEAVAKTGEPLAAFEKRYEEELEKLRLQAVEAGDLELVLAVKAEAENFRQGDTPPASQPDLRKLQQIFARESVRLSEERETAIGTLRGGYLEALGILEARLTQADQIEAALEVRKEIERLSQESGPGPRQSAPSAMDEAFTRMEEKADRAKEESLAAWLAGTVWKRGTGAVIRFDDQTRLRRARPERNIIDGGTFDTDEEKQHVLITWEGGGTTTLELARDQVRLNDRARSATWVRLDQHLAAVETITRRGIPDSERDLARRIKGTVWSRNHNAAPPFLYEFTEDGNLFLSIWGGNWRNQKPYQITGPGQLTIENQFKVEISEDFSTWRGIDGGMTGILIRAD